MEHVDLKVHVKEILQGKSCLCLNLSTSELREETLTDGPRLLTTEIQQPFKTGPALPHRTVTVTKSAHHVSIC